MWLNSQRFPRGSIYEDFVFSGVQRGWLPGPLHHMDPLPMAREPRALECGLGGSMSSSNSPSL